MERSEAIEFLARKELQALSSEARLEQLETMLLEVWDLDPQWSMLAADVRHEFDEGVLIESPDSSRYDPVLLLWLRGRYSGARSEYLQKCLRAYGNHAAEVLGDPEPLEACPCCGRATLGARGEYHICRVCWWEDNGQDNDRADSVLGGPNGKLSLTVARANFLRHGIYDPARTDLRAHQEPPDKYHERRFFRLREDGHWIEEADRAWESNVF